MPPQQSPPWKRKELQCLIRSGVNKKTCAEEKGSGRAFSAGEAWHLPGERPVGVGVWSPRADCETLRGHYSSLTTIKWIRRSSCPFGVSNPPAAKPPQFSAATCLSTPSSRLVPVSDSQVHALHSPHSGGSSRLVATWSTVPTSLMPARIKDIGQCLPSASTIPLWAPPSLDRNKVMCTTRRPALSGSRRGEPATQGSQPPPTVGLSFHSAQAQAVKHRLEKPTSRRSWRWAAGS